MSGSIKKTVKREVVRAALERSQSVDLEKFGSPKASEAVYFDNVRETLNVPYMNRDEIPLAMDIFEPIVPEGTELPVVVTIHGGGLTLGDRKISRPFSRILASKGYLVFSIEYRLAPRANVCMELDDVCAGLDLVGRKLVDYDVDFSRIFIAAESAGAYLAMYVTAMSGSKLLQEAIGYEPTRVKFKAIGLISGMLYTNRNDPNGWSLAEQIYGDKRTDENFLQYMNPEHPEIINNLPPAYLITSRGDGFNNYSIMMNEALKKAGKTCHLDYYGDADLAHAFTTLQTDDPRAIASIDKMLAWFEQQAKYNAFNEKNSKTIIENIKKYEAERSTGKKDNQKIYQYIKEIYALYPNRKNLPAIIDCSRTYTYEQMFEQWDKYAKVFTGLGMTGDKKCRVGIAGTISAEPLFAYYGLNMVGTTVSMFSYPDFLPGGRWESMVENEHITDLILSDIMVTPQMWVELRKAKKRLKLRNIILLHTRMGGPCIGPSEMIFNEFNYHALKRIDDIVFMEDLIDKYKDTEIKYADKTGDQLAIITHTSGTSNGTRKPLPFTDKKINGIASFSPTRKATDEALGNSNARLLPPFDFSASMCINGFVNYAFVAGDAVILTFFGFLHPKYVRVYKYYGVALSFTSGFMIDKWMQMPDLDDDAFASLQIFGIGGSYTPPAKVEKYEAFLREHGFKGFFSQSYGMSEIADAALEVPKGCREDVLGYPTCPDNIRILDDEDGRFYKIEDGARNGMMYVRSDSMCDNVLDGKQLFELTNIDGKDFLCSQDVVRVNSDGSLSYAGRGNQFFVTKEGVRFESGEVQTLLSAQDAIGTLAIVPTFDKRIYDNVPVLYIIPANKGNNAAEEIRRAIVNVFVNNDRLKDSVLPTQFVIVDNIPCNSNGKVDVYQITRNRLKGIAYNINPVKKDGQLVDVKLERAEQISSMIAGTLPEGMGSDSAFGIFDIFSAPPEMNKMKKNAKEHSEKRKEIKEKMRERNEENKSKVIEKLKGRIEFDENGLPKVPDKIKNTFNEIIGIMYDQCTYNHDFED